MARARPAPGTVSRNATNKSPKHSSWLATMAWAAPTIDPRGIMSTLSRTFMAHAPATAQAASPCRRCATSKWNNVSLRNDAGSAQINSASAGAAGEKLEPSNSETMRGACIVTNAATPSVSSRWMRNDLRHRTRSASWGPSALRAIMGNRSER